MPTICINEHIIFIWEHPTCLLVLNKCLTYNSENTFSEYYHLQIVTICLWRPLLWDPILNNDLLSTTATIFGSREWSLYSGLTVPWVACKKCERALMQDFERLLRQSIIVALFAGTSLEANKKRDLYKATKVWFVQSIECNGLEYRKLVETFHNVSECKTVVYFIWWFTLQFRWLGDLTKVFIKVLTAFPKKVTRPFQY